MNVVIKYDPYHRKTYMTVDTLDISNAPESAGYGRIKKQIMKGDPIQTWLEKRGEWKGILNELISDQSSDNVNFFFSGRKIDFEDLRHACESQNTERGEYRCNLKFTLEYEITDDQTAKNIEEVVAELQSERFKKLVEESKFDSSLEEKYKNFKENYDKARNDEFTITVAGIFSSGKSTIINSLIRHKALPVDPDTCTKKICKIRDNPELKPNELRLLIKDNATDKPIEEVRYSEDNKADNDKKCFEKIKSVKNDNVIMILEADLGHLYPNAKSRNMFKLVIIDTPGTDSNESDDGNGHNADEDIALDAVFNSNGDMVILSIKECDVDSQGLTRLVGGISKKFDKVSDVYNDRFLFVVNQCDKRQFTAEKNTTDFIDRYRGKLKDITGNPSFTPRIFPMCAAVPGYIYAGDESCCGGATNFIKYIYGGDDGIAFIKRHIDPNPNYYFSQYCDVPQYRKDLYKEEFNRIKSDDQIKATLLQSGFVCLEDAIKDYIERFAYPIRIRRILSTYESIPGSVINCLKMQEKILENQRANLGKAQNEGKVAKEKEKEEKERAEKLQKAKSVIDSMKQKVDECYFDDNFVYKEKEKLISGLYAISGSYEQAELPYEEARKVLDSIVKNAKSLLEEYSNNMNICWNNIFQKLKMTIDDAKIRLKQEIKQETFNFDGFDFSQSEAFFNFEGFDFDDWNTSEYRYTQYETKRNPEKDEYYEWWQLFSKIKQAFAPKTIIETKQMVKIGAYLADEIKKIEGNVSYSSEKMKTSYVTCFEKTKSNIANLIDAISKSLEVAISKVTENEIKVRNSLKTVQAISSSISSMLLDKKWLEELSQKIKAVLPWE